MEGFRPIELSNRDDIQRRLWAYQPVTSELTFTNLFIWRASYDIKWAIKDDVLFLTGEHDDDSRFAFPPISSGDRTEAVRLILKDVSSIERADQRLVDELKQSTDLKIEPVRDHADYLYASKDLVELPGSKYHAKRNHIAKALKAHEIRYETLKEEHIGACLELSGSWCAFRKCHENKQIRAECEASVECLRYFSELKLKGGALFVDGKLSAFSLGEMLNDRTAVIHMEKADLSDQDLYAVMNQRFAEDAWKETEFINREQDLGAEGLRKAKLSYHPQHLEQKFRIVRN